MAAIWVGIDVSKARLDVAVRPTGEVVTIDNDEAGIKNLLKLIAKWSPQLIVMEATGGYEYACAYRLMKAGFSVAVVNPRQVRDFARAVGRCTVKLHGCCDFNTKDDAYADALQAGEDWPRTQTRDNWSTHIQPRSSIRGCSAGYCLAK